MSTRGAPKFTAWVEAMLADTGWTAATVREAVNRGRDDLASAALADGFTAAAHGLAASAGERGGGHR